MVHIKYMKEKYQTTQNLNMIYMGSCLSYNSMFNEELFDDVPQVQTFLYGH